MQQQLSDQRPDPAVGLAGLGEVARRLESMCETLRQQIGRDSNSDWRGLQGALSEHPQRAEATRRLADDLGDALNLEEGDQALVGTFLLRQLEIAMTLLSRTSQELLAIRQRMDEFDRRLAIIEMKTQTSPRVVAPEELF